MYHLLWILNLSEVQNNSSCDPMGYMERYHYRVTYASRDNFDECFRGDLSEYDCIILASNALRDAAIIEKLSISENKMKLKRYVMNNGACIIFHQNMENGFQFDFFDLQELSFKILKFQSSVDEVVEPAFKLFDNYFLFPHEIDLYQMSKNMHEDLYYEGLYWRMFQPDTDDWNSIVISSKQKPQIRVSTKFKVIISTLVLDYQQQYAFIDNLIVNTINKKNIGYVADFSTYSNATASLINDLENNNIYVARYDIYNSAEIELLHKRIEDGIHKILIVLTNDEYIGEQIREKCKEHFVKCIFSGNELKIFDYSNVYLNHYQEIEFEIQTRLGEGLIEGSFARTINILKILVESPYSFGRYDTKNLTCVDAIIRDNYCEDGSYNKSFGGTCQMIWFFSKFIPGDARIEKAQKWLQEKVKRGKNQISIREKIDYLIAVQAGNEEIEYTIRQYLQESTKKGTYDLLSGFQAAYAIHNAELMQEIMDIIVQQDVFSIDESIKVAWGLIQTIKASSRRKRLYYEYLENQMEKIKRWNKVSRENYYLKKLEIAYLMCTYNEIKEFNDAQIISLIENVPDKTNEKAAISAIEELRRKNYDQRQAIDQLEGTIEKMKKDFAKAKMKINVINRYKWGFWFVCSFFLFFGMTALVTIAWLNRSGYWNELKEYVILEVGQNEIMLSIVFSIIIPIAVGLTRQAYEIRKQIREGGEEKQC